MSEASNVCVCETLTNSFFFFKFVEKNNRWEKPGKNEAVVGFWRWGEQEKQIIHKKKLFRSRILERECVVCFFFLYLSIWNLWGERRERERESRVSLERNVKWFWTVSWLSISIWMWLKNLLKDVCFVESDSVFRRAE